jgi:hypothetical protein
MDHMAIVQGPLHSDMVSGGFSKRLTFARGRRGTIVKAYSKPGDRVKAAPTTTQSAVRLRTGNLMKQWPTLSAADRRSWIEWGEHRGLEPLMAFFTYNWDRLKQGLSVITNSAGVEGTDLQDETAFSFFALSFDNAAFV